MNHYYCQSGNFGRNPLDYKISEIVFFIEKKVDWHGSNWLIWRESARPLFSILRTEKKPSDFQPCKRFSMF